MNWTSSFLFQSDKHAIVPHLPLASVDTVEKASRARTWSSSESESGGGVAMLSAESLVDAVIGWWMDKSLIIRSDGLRGSNEIWRSISQRKLQHVYQPNHRDVDRPQVHLHSL